MPLSFSTFKFTLKFPASIACLAFFMSLPLPSIAQNLAQNQSQNPLQNPLSNTAKNTALDSLQPQNPTQNLNPFKDFSQIDSSILQSYSTFIPRYNTRFDTKHNLNLNAFGGQINIDSAKNQYISQSHITQNYGGLRLSYDNIIERYGLGAFVSYVYNDAKNTNLAKAHTAIVGAFLDFFIDSHHIKAHLAQSFNFFDLDSIKGITSSATNVEASYGFVFPLKTKGSFIEPFSKFSIASLFGIEKKGLDLPNYALHSHIELGAHFRQFIGDDKVYFYITPSFIQTIGIDKNDPLLRVINVDEYGQAQIMMNDNLYRSYGLLLVGIDFRLRPSVRLFLQANGKITQNLYSYGGNLGLNIAF